MFFGRDIVTMACVGTMLNGQSTMIPCIGVVGNAGTKWIKTKVWLRGSCDAILQCTCIRARELRPVKTAFHLDHGRTVHS